MPVLGADMLNAISLAAEQLHNAHIPDAGMADAELSVYDCRAEVEAAEYGPVACAAAPGRQAVRSHGVSAGRAMGPDACAGAGAVQVDSGQAGNATGLDAAPHVRGGVEACHPTPGLRQVSNLNYRNV